MKATRKHFITHIDGQQLTGPQPAGSTVAAGNARPSTRRHIGLRQPSGLFLSLSLLWILAAMQPVQSQERFSMNDTPLFVKPYPSPKTMVPKKPQPIDIPVGEKTPNQIEAALKNNDKLKEQANKRECDHLAQRINTFDATWLKNRKGENYYPQLDALFYIYPETESDQRRVVFAQFKIQHSANETFSTLPASRSDGLAVELYSKDVDGRPAYQVESLEIMNWAEMIEAERETDISEYESSWLSFSERQENRAKSDKSLFQTKDPRLLTGSAKFAVEVKKNQVCECWFEGNRWVSYIDNTAYPQIECIMDTSFFQQYIATQYHQTTPFDLGEHLDTNSIDKN